jgi:hypothetical protein
MSISKTYAVCTENVWSKMGGSRQNITTAVTVEKSRHVHVQTVCTGCNCSAYLHTLPCISTCANVSSSNVLCDLIVVTKLLDSKDKKFGYFALVIS